MPSIPTDVGPVLALSAEPGDEVFGCGGTLALHAAQGQQVHVWLPEPGRDAEADASIAAANAAASMLGYSAPRRWSLADAPFAYNERAVQELVDAIRSLALLRIYAPSVDEADVRRSRLGLLAREAVRRAGARCELAVYELGAPGVITGYVDISSVIAAKRVAIEQLGRLPAASALGRRALALSTLRAPAVGTDASDAEGFDLLTAAAIADVTPGLRSRPAGSATPDAAADPLVSVIVRTTARETLDETLDSIAAQTYRRIEVLLVDVAGQGSIGRPDHCGELPMRTVSAGRWLSRGAAANLGLAEAQGGYALMLDDDDWLLPEHIAGLVDAVAADAHAEAAYAGIECRRQSESGEWQVLHTFNSPYDPVRLLIENYLPIHAVLFARHLLGARLAFDEQLDVYEDWDFWIQLSALTPLIHVDRVSAVYRIAQESGFGLRKSDEALDPGLSAIFTKWRTRWTLSQLLALVDYAKHRSMYLELRDDSAAKYRALSERLDKAKFDLEQQKIQHAILAADKRTVEQQIATLHERIMGSDARQRVLESAREADRELLSVLGIQTLNDALVCREELASYRSFHGRLLSSLSFAMSPLGRPYRFAAAVVRRIKRPFVRLAAHGRHLAESARAYGVQAVSRALLCKLRRAGTCNEPSIKDLWQVLEISSIGFKAHPKPVATVIIDPTQVAPETVRVLKGLAHGQHVPPFNVLLHYPAGHPIEGPLRARVPSALLLALAPEASTSDILRAALDTSSTDWLLLLSCVNIQPNDWLARMLQTAQDSRFSGLAVGGVCVKMMGTNGRLSQAGSLRIRDGSLLKIGEGQDVLAPEYNFLREVDSGSDACLLLNRQALLAAAPHGGASRPELAGVDAVCLAMRASGWSILYQPEITAVVPVPAVRADAPATLVGHARKRALVIDAVMLTPDQDSGSLRMFNLLEAFLAQDWHVTFAPSNLEYCEPYGPQLQRRGIEVLHAPQTVSISDFLLRRGAEYDLVIVSRALVANVVLDDVRLHAPQAWLWFDTVDLHFLREQREADLRGDPAALKLAEQRKRQELDFMRRSDLTLVVSHIEQELLAEEAPDVRVEILSNIHDLHPTKTPFGERDAVVFIGGFNHGPNVDAVRYYVHEILPLVEAQLGRVPTFILGSRPTLDVLALEDEERGIHVTGYVEDVTPYFERARLSIAPLRYGAGVKGKINMSMAYGVPVVATPCAAEGMFLTSGDDILVGEDSSAFAQAVANVYRDEALWERLSRAGMANIDTHFSRRTASATLERLLAERTA